MIIEPSKKLFQSLTDGNYDKDGKSLFSGEFDMDLLNRVLRNSVRYLDYRLGVLDLFFIMNKPPPGPEVDLDVMAKQVYSAHFSSAKPWKTNFKSVEEIRGFQPEGHEFFVQVWKMWYDGRDEVCGSDFHEYSTLVL